jgi:hypothetical protein
MVSNIMRIPAEYINILKGYLKWKGSAYQFTNFVNKWDFKQDESHEPGNNIAIIVQPWSRTATPWLLIGIGLFLARSNKKVTFILDDLEFGNDTLFFNIQLKSIKEILSRLPGSIKIIELSTMKENEKESFTADKLTIDYLATLNTIHFMRGELIQDGRLQYFETVSRQLENSAAPINRLLGEMPFNLILVAGGIWGSSGLYLKIARKYNIRVATFDAGFGTILINTSGVATHQTDIPIAFHRLENIYEDKILEIAENEMKKRKQGIQTDNPQQGAYQKIPYMENGPTNNVGILMLLNIVWDSAALGLHTIFENMEEWITESVAWALENTEDIITVRQHPAERNAAGRSTDDYYSLLIQRFGDNRRVRFISATEDVNTYNLIEKSLYVIAFSTTASMEAVAMGKVVVNVSGCYYSNLGFVYNPKTKDEYFTFLKNASAGRLNVSEKNKEDALKCYYLTQCCNLLHSVFTPQPLDFQKWVRDDPEVVFQLPEVKHILYAIENDIPISLVRHHDLMVRISPTLDRESNIEKFQY